MSKDIQEIFEELNSIKDEFIDDSDQEVFAYYLSEPSAVLMEMAIVRGVDARPEQLPFSFYFSEKSVVHSKHGIRVKVQWNPIRMKSKDADGYFIIHGNEFPYEWVPGSHKYRPTAKEIKLASQFIKKYKVLFSAVWEEVLDEVDLEDYFKGRISWKDLLECFHTKDVEGDLLIQASKDLKDLEYTVREENLFNMND